MALSKKELDELQPIIHETVAKRLGFPEQAVMKAATSCLSEKLDHESATEKMSGLLGDDLASRFVEDLLNNVNKFRYLKFKDFLLQVSKYVYKHLRSSCIEVL